MRAMCRIRSLRMNSLPARSVIQPTMGHARISLFATNRVGRTLEMRKMSIHETRLAAIIGAASPAPGGVPPEMGERLGARAAPGRAPAPRRSGGVEETQGDRRLRGVRDEPRPAQ